MANWSYTVITITGTNEKLKEVEKELNSYMEGAYLCVSKLAPTNSISDRAGFGGMEIHSLELSETMLSIVGSGRWCAPSAYFIDLCERHKISCEYEDEESGCDFYHAITIEDGDVTKDVEYNYGSYEHMASGCVISWIERDDWIGEDKNWEEEYAEKIESYRRLGAGIERRRKEWGNVKA